MQADLALLALPGPDDLAADEDRARDEPRRRASRQDASAEPVVANEQLGVEFREGVVLGQEADTSIGPARSSGPVSVLNIDRRGSRTSASSSTAVSLGPIAAQVALASAGVTPVQRARSLTVAGPSQWRNRRASSRRASSVERVARARVSDRLSHVPDGRHPAPSGVVDLVGESLQGGRPLRIPRQATECEHPDIRARDDVVGAAAEPDLDELRVLPEVRLRAFDPSVEGEDAAAWHRVLQAAPGRVRD